MVTLTPMEPGHLDPVQQMSGRHARAPWSLRTLGLVLTVGLALTAFGESRESGMRGMSRSPW